MADLFASPKSTLARAHHHIRDLESQVSAFVCDKPWSYLIEKNPDGTEEVHKIRFTRQIPEILACIIFDAASNLRAVLDQCGYASAVASGKINPKNTYFPFGDDLPGLNNNIEGRKVCKDLPPEIITLFRGFKPYKGENNSLWASNKLCNTQKHCALVPLQVSNPSAFFSGKITGDGWVSDIVSPGGFGIGWDAEKYEIKLMINQAGAKADVNTNIAFDIAIDGIDILGGKSAVSVLDTMRSEVERVLVATEAECRRLGFIK